MTKTKGNLMTVRSDIKVLDATIRDGGLCNNFEFTDEFVKELYWSNIRCGVDYMSLATRRPKDCLTSLHSVNGNSAKKKTFVRLSVTMRVR